MLTITYVDKVIVEVSLLRDAKAGETIAIPVNPHELILLHETRDAERHMRLLRCRIRDSQEELGRPREEREALDSEAEKRVREGGNSETSRERMECQNGRGNIMS